MLEDGYEYIIKACNIYESDGWVFQDELSYNLAKDTISALKHINEHTDIEIDNALLEIDPTFHEK